MTRPHHNHSINELPEPELEARLVSESLKNELAEYIKSQGGWIGFDHFMEKVLYAPSLGYYAGGSLKFGKQGDFVTAPEISPLFGRSLAVQAAEVMRLSAPQIIEVGAGSGRLAVDLLLGLEQMGQLPKSYQILELSGELRERQKNLLQQTLPHLMARISWLERLPETFDGLVLGNEVLDAMPVHLVHWGAERKTDGAAENIDSADPIFERGVIWQEDHFAWQDRPATGRLLKEAQALQQTHALTGGYVSEINLMAADWVSAWGNILQTGALLLIDYGFPVHEYYHPQRYTGTLMCHYRHHAHGDPFFLPGLQDVTAHVDFTAIAQAGFNAGFDVLGYAAQGNFLLNCGIMDLLAAAYPFDGRIEYLKQSQGVQKLILPTDMGELFKVIALGKGIDAVLTGFVEQDKTHSL